MKTFLIYSFEVHSREKFPLEVIETDYSIEYVRDYVKERFKDNQLSVAVMRIDHTKIFKNIEGQPLVRKQD